MFVGIDNLNVFNFVSKLLDGSEWLPPLPLRKDRNIIAYIQGILDKRNGTDEMVEGVVLDGKMMMEMKQRTEGRRARRRTQIASSLWNSIVCDVHRFFIIVVNNDGKGGSVPDSLTKKARMNSSVRDGFLALLHLGPGDGMADHIFISSDDVEGWPCPVSLLVKFSAFLKTLHWLFC